MTITIPSGRTLPLKAKAGGGFQSNGIADSVIQIAFTLNQAQAIFAAMNTEPAPVDAIWASALAPDQADGDLTQDGSESNPYSVRRAIYSATPGKHVLLKDDGVYTQSKEIQTKGQFEEDTYVTHTAEDPNIIPWNMTEPTSAAEKIVIRGAPGTCPVFDFTSTYFDIAFDFLEFAYLRINNAATAFAMSLPTGGLSGPSQGTRIHHVCGEFFRQIGGSGNVGFFGFGSGSSGSGGVAPVVEYCFVKGNNSTTNLNNACVYIDKANKFTVRNSYFYGVIPHVVFFKAGNDYITAGGLGTVDITFENNYCDGNITWAGSGATLQNNIVTGNLENKAIGTSGAYQQDYNELLNNTVIGRITLSKVTEDSDNCTVKNNIMNMLEVQGGGNGTEELDPATNTNASDYNLINAADDGQRFIWDSTNRVPPQYKTLTEWRSYISLDLNSAVQADQLVGQGTYTTLSDFNLVGGSVGLTLSESGGAVGADTSLVGVQ